MIGLASFGVGFGVNAVLDNLFTCQCHLIRNPDVPLINLRIGAFRLYGPLQFGIGTMLAVVLWRAIDGWLRPALDEPRRDGPAGTVFALAMVVVGLRLGWCEYPHMTHYLTWSIASYAVSLGFVGLAWSRRRLAAFLVMSLLGVGAELLALDPSIGYWRFVQPDLFGRVPAWELFVYGWAGIVVHHLAGWLDPRP